MDNQIIFGVTDEQSGYKDEILLTNMSNRHGCITGATGTGKTVSLQKLAESSPRKAFRYSLRISKVTCRALQKLRCRQTS